MTQNRHKNKRLREGFRNFTSAALDLVGIWPMGVCDGREGAGWVDWVLDELYLCSAVEKGEGSRFPLLLTVERALDSSRIGEGVSLQGGLGETVSGDPRGVRRGEQVKPKVGSDLWAAGRVKNKHRCSNRWLHMLAREQKVNIYTCWCKHLQWSCRCSAVVFIKENKKRLAKSSEGVDTQRVLQVRSCSLYMYPFQVFLD